MKFDIWWFFEIYCENSGFIKMWQEWRVIYMTTNIHFRSYLAQFFLELINVSDKRCRKARNTNFVLNNFFFEIKGHGPLSSKIVVLFYVLFVLYCSMYCLCVNVYCHRVTTQLHLTNISYQEKRNILSESLLIKISQFHMSYLFYLLSNDGKV